MSSSEHESVSHDTAASPIAAHRRSHGVFAGNAQISLIDLGDGIGCFELHSRMNVLGNEVVSFLIAALRPGSTAMESFDGFILSTDAAHFSVGADLKQMLRWAQNQQWNDIRDFISDFQVMTQAIKFSPKPVVAAPAGLCLGGGCEVCLHAARRQPLLELSAGLVETGVGLLPAGGGCKEMLLRAISGATAIAPDSSATIGDLLHSVFETIAEAKRSKSAIEARDLLLLDKTDSISMDRTQLIHDAKLQALRLLEHSYAAPVMRSDIPAPGRPAFAALTLSIHEQWQAKSISEHDAKVATRVARVLTGGDVAPGTRMSEQYLLELELEAFLSLFAEPKTIERVAFTLSSGKLLKD